MFRAVETLAFTTGSGARLVFDTNSEQFYQCCREAGRQQQAEHVTGAGIRFT
jgi:hypothetical protein